MGWREREGVKEGRRIENVGDESFVILYQISDGWSKIILRDTRDTIYRLGFLGIKKKRLKDLSVNNP
jgi:hypothetical protein